MTFTPNTIPTFIRQPNRGLVQITTGTGSSTLVTVYTGGSSNGSRVNGLIATAVGTTNPYDVVWGITTGGTFYTIGTVSVSCSAGSSDSIATINLLGNTNLPGVPLDSDGNPYVTLSSSTDTLQAKTPATSSTWATGAVINLVAFTGDF